LSKRKVPETRILMVDKDCVVDMSWLKRYREMVKMVLRSYRLAPTAIRITPSKRRGFHVRVYLEAPIPAEEANMLQWILGDDDHRVDFNRARIDAGFDEWSKLFEAPRRSES